MSNNEVTLPALLEQALTATRAANAKVQEVERQLSAARETRAKAQAEQDKLERLMRGTGQIASIAISFGPQGQYHACNGGDAARLALADLPKGAEIVKLEDLGGGGSDPGHWSASVRVYYALPALQS